MKTSLIAIVIIIIAVVIVGAFAAMTMMPGTAPQQNLTTKGTKLNLQNNNNQLWEHMDIVIENATLKNGSKQNFYMEVWVKPGQNLTMDLSNIMGYGNAPLPTGTVIKTLDWGSVLNNTAGGTNSFAMTLQGWSNTATPVNAPKYDVKFSNMPIGPLPSKVTDNLMYYNTSKDAADSYTSTNYPHNDAYEVMFTEIDMTVDPNGNLIMTFAVPPTLCQTIAHIIS